MLGIVSLLRTMRYLRELLFIDEQILVGLFKRIVPFRRRCWTKSYAYINRPRRQTQTRATVLS